MQRAFIASLLVLTSGSGLCRGQVAGNIGYSQTGGKAKAEQSDRAMRLLAKDDLPPTGTTMFVETNVLINVKADEYVAVYGLSHEGETLAECSKKMDATVKVFSDDLKSLGIGASDLFVDFVAQNRIYGFQVQGNIAQEKLVGFELKKNVSIHYTEHSQLEKLNLAAAKSQVFDLIKVDYIVKDINRVQDRLLEEAARITKNKMSRYEKLLGIKLQPPAQVYAEKSAIHYPTQLYDSYTAFESEEIRSGSERQKSMIQQARKSRTFFFNGLDGNGFDAVINPVIIEPVVQCTFYLKVKYEVEQVRAK